MAEAQDNKILLKRSSISGATPASLSNGEIAVNIADQLIFVGSTNGNYITFNSVGPTGPQGFQGTQGVQGTQGRQGTQGTQGRQGTQGTQGDQGDQGTTGPQGFQGTQGTQGTQGRQGPQGVQGTQGTQGVQGTQGTQGRQGTQGDQGDQGTTGPQGFQGTQGTQGRQGPQGVQGTQGRQGTQGDQGDQGTTGPQGFQGTQGTQGRQGTQGTQGTQGRQGPQGVQGTQGNQGPTGIVGTINSQSGVETLNIVGGSNLNVTNGVIGNTLTVTINEDGPTNAYGLTSYDNGKGVQVYDKLSFIYGKGNNSGALDPGLSTNFSSVDEYYYSNDIQYDSWNKITTLLRFNEKIHVNGGITGPTSATSGGPWTIDMNNGTLQYINLSNATTGTTKYFEFVPSITNSSFYNSSISFLLMIVGGGNPALTIQWPSGTKWENDLGAPTLGSTQQLTIIPFTYVMGDGFVTGVTGWYGGADLKYSLTGS